MSPVLVCRDLKSGFTPAEQDAVSALDSCGCSRFDSRAVLLDERKWDSFRGRDEWTKVMLVCQCDQWDGFDLNVFCECTGGVGVGDFGMHPLLSPAGFLWNKE